MSQEIEQLIERLKTAETSDEIAKLTVALLRGCGVYNYQAVAQRMAHSCVTHRVLGG